MAKMLDKKQKVIERAYELLDKDKKAIAEEYEAHGKHQKFIAALNKFYAEQPALWEKGLSTGLGG